MISAGLIKMASLLMLIPASIIRGLPHQSSLVRITRSAEDITQRLEMPPFPSSLSEEIDDPRSLGKEGKDLEIGPRLAALRKRSAGVAYTAKNRLSEEQRNRMVSDHNTLRFTEAVKYGVTGMIELTWNDTLADMAQYWAENCIFEHGNLESGVYQIGTAGQNLAVSSDPNYSVDDLIEMWFNERENYDYDAGQCVTGMCGHYTQLVKDYTTYIGCATAVCPVISFPSGGEDDDSWPNSLYLVCNYDVSNIVGEKPFYTGEPCSDCQVNMLVPYRCGPETGNLCEKCSREETDCTQPLCEDSSMLGRYCPIWSMNGYCSNALYYLFMKQHCRKTCMMC